MMSKRIATVSTSGDVVVHQRVRVEAMNHKDAEITERSVNSAPSMSPVSTFLAGFADDALLHSTKS
jgi:hypothetical protein